MSIQTPTLPPLDAPRVPARARIFDSPTRPTGGLQGARTWWASFALIGLWALVAGVAVLLSVGIAGEAHAAGRTASFTMTALQPTARSAESDARAATDLAAQLERSRATATTTFVALIRQDAVALDGVRRAMTEAGYGAAERGAAFRDGIELDLAAKDLASTGMRAEEVYMELRHWMVPAAEAATAAAESGAALDDEELAWVMWAGGASTEDVLLFLLAEGWTLDAILDLLAEMSGDDGIEATLARYAEVLRILDGWRADGLHYVKAWIDDAEDRLIQRAHDLLYESGLRGADLVDRLGQFLRMQVGLGWEWAAGKLLRVGATAEQVAAWLVGKVGVSTDVLLAFLEKQAGISAGRALATLQSLAGWSGEGIGKIAQLWGLTKAQLAALLRAAGLTAQEVLDAMIEAYGVSALDAIRDAMLAAGYGWNEVIAALQTVQSAVESAFDEAADHLTSKWMGR